MSLYRYLVTWKVPAEPEKPGDDWERSWLECVFEAVAPDAKDAVYQTGFLAANAPDTMPRAFHSGTRSPFVVKVEITHEIALPRFEAMPCQ